MRVEVRTSGVDDPDGFDDFALIGIGAAMPSDGACATPTTTGAERSRRRSRRARSTFETSALEGSTRVLLLRRGEDQRRWSLG